ncbi:MAG: LiaF transmembrane domain-containing protein [Massilia sp.]
MARARIDPDAGFCHFWGKFWPFAEFRVIHRPANAIRRLPLSSPQGASYCEAVLSTGGKMNTENGYEQRRQLMWGLFLIAMGITFMLDQMDLIDVRGLWHYALLIPVVFGVNKMIGYPTAKHFSSGLWNVFVGLWLFAVFEDLFGLTFANSWPLFIIVCGISMMAESYLKDRFAANEGERNEK